MNPSRISLIFGISGWVFGLVIFALIQASGTAATRNPLLEYTPLLCGCILPTLWVVGAMLGANHAMSFARANQRVPRSGVAGLVLNLIGLAATMVFMLLNLIAA